MSDRYLDLLKRVLTGAVFPESADVFIQKKSSGSLKASARNFIIDAAARRGYRFVKRRRFDAEKREEGADWPSIGYTMVGIKRLTNVQHAIETVVAEGIPGDVVECGVWRGGCTIFMRAVLETLGDTERRVWAADSFDGLPRPDAPKYPADQGYDLSQYDYLSVPLEAVRDNFERFGLLDDRVVFLKGWFRDTLPGAEIDKIAVLRADGDLYESTMDILQSLYPKVSPGGFVIIDDYASWEPCRKAVTEYRARHGIDSPLHMVDRNCAYWRTPSAAVAADTMPTAATPASGPAAAEFNHS